MTQSCVVRVDKTITIFRKVWVFYYHLKNNKTFFFMLEPIDEGIVYEENVIEIKKKSCLSFVKYFLNCS